MTESYKLIKRIGSGAFAEVWLAEAPGGVQVAVKRLLHIMERDAARRELDALEHTKNLRHQSLLETHAFWISEDRLHIAMALADQTLRDRQRECQKQGLKGIPRDELLRYFREAADALDHLHQQKLVHRDIKPENILLRAGHVKVADFGMTHEFHSQHLSASNVAGTFLYMAAEVWSNRVEPASDQYSLAMSYAELAMGRHPFAAQAQQGGPQGLILAHQNETPDLADLPEAEQKSLLRALAKKPADRFPSCLDFIDALPTPGGSGVYKLDKLLNQGTFAEVWLARAPDGAHVAVKRLLHVMEKDAAQRASEALERIKGLRHPFLLETHSFWFKEDRLHIVMGLADQTLRGRLQECQAQGQKGIPDDELIRYFREAADGLDYLHEQKVVHRDVKPENLLLRAGHITIADFDLARVLHRPRMSTRGSFLYMAPETENNKFGYLSDQYSLALTYAELAMGRHPLEGQLRQGGANGETATFQKEEPDLADLPESKRKVVLRALSKEPANRFPSCRHFVEALESHNYVLLARVGSGSFAEVFLAEAPGGVQVAVKRLHQVMGKEAAQREFNALEKTKNLRHPYLLETHAFWLKEDRLHIAMTLADKHLRDRLYECRGQEQVGIPHDELIRYISEAAEGLDYLHKHQLVHRDVKPENLLLRTGQVKVGDFGLTRELHTPHASTGGTLLYMAPEAWSNQVDYASDQYSLALTYAELVTGRHPFEAQAQLEGQYGLMKAHHGGEPNFGDIPECRKQVLLKALAKEPAQRYASCREFAEALRQAGLSSPLPPLESFQEPSGVSADTSDALDSSQSSIDIQLLNSGPSTREQWRKPGTEPTSRAWLWLVPLLILAAVGVGGYRLLGLWGGGSTVALEAPPEPVVVGTGESKTITITIDRKDFEGPVELRLVGAPRSDLTIALPTVGEGETRAEVVVEAAPQSERGLRNVVVEANSGGRRLGEVNFDLIVVPLPPFCFPESDQIEQDRRGNRFYRRIFGKLPDGTPVPFELVWTRATTDPSAFYEAFYMMRDKVSVGLFKQFAAEHALKNSPLWNKDADPRLPALGISVEDAHDFAVWIGGLLPTVQQWDTAAGFHEVPRGEGPFQGSWTRSLAVQGAAYVGARAAALNGPFLAAATVLAPSGLRISLSRQAPLPVGKAADDYSPFGCRDMAGNGYEWTRNLNGTNDFVPLAREPRDSDWIDLRGRSYQLPHPFRFQDLADQDRKDMIIMRYRETKPYLGFRVVIQP